MRGSIFRKMGIGFLISTLLLGALPAIAVESPSLLDSLRAQISALQQQVQDLLARLGPAYSFTAQVSGAVLPPPGQATREIVIARSGTTTFRLGSTAGNSQLAQSFRVTDVSIANLINPSISGVQLRLSRRGSIAQPITVSIRQTLSGPDLVKTVVIPNFSDVLDGRAIWMDAAFSSPLLVTGKTMYFLVLSVTPPPPTPAGSAITDFYRWHVAEGNVYTNGRFFQRSNPYDKYDAVAVIKLGSKSASNNTLVVAPSSALSSQSLVEGSVGVELGRFTLDASASGEDLRVTVVKVRANVTNADIDDFQSLQLWDGTTAINTGSNILNPSGNADGTDGTLTFTTDSPGFIIPKGSLKDISLKGNVLTTANSGDQIQMEFTSLTDGDWGVTGKDSGADVIEDLDTSTSGAVMTINTGGGWSVESSPAAPIEKWVPAGATGVTLNVLRLRATTESFALSDLRLQIDATGSSTGSDFAKIYLYDGSTLLASKVPSFTNGVEDFVFPTVGSGSFIIPANSFKELTIKADLANIGSSLPGNAGELVGVDYDGATSSKNKAVGQSSGLGVHSSTVTDVMGNGVVYFRSVPTIERVTIPSTSLSSGNHVLYKFKITADPAYDVALHKVMFKVATTGITGFGASVPSFTLWNITDNKRVGAATGAAAAFFQEQGNYDNSSNLVVRIYADTTDYSNAWVTVPKGQTHTFELRGSITSDGSGDSVSTKLLGDDARSPRVTLTGAARRPIGKVTFIDADKSVERPGFVGESANVASSSSFIWTDFSSDATTTHALTTADWMNGFRIPGLPSTGLDASTLSN